MEKLSAAGYYPPLLLQELYSKYTTTLNALIIIR